MKQEDKDLLLRDLCARLPYGVIVRHADIDDNYNETGEFHYTKGYLYDVCRIDMTTTIIESEGEREGYDHICLLERTIPYLRPMSSMTEKENEELNCLCYHNIGVQDNMLQGYLCGGEINDVIDWLNVHHFDYRGLIEKGLALPALESTNFNTF